MLAKFFGKSAPINYLFLSIVLLCGTLLYAFWGDQAPVENLFAVLGVGGLLVFSLLLLDFIIRKNRLNAGNNFGIYAFTLLALTIPQALARIELVWATVFCLLALRRIFSLSKPRNTEKKILDAAIYIALASFFSFYSILLLLLLYYAILAMSTVRFNYLVIPVLGFVAVGLLLTVFWILMYNSFNWFGQLELLPVLDFSAYLDPGLMFLTGFIFLLGLLSVFTTLRRIRRLNRKARPFYLILPLAIMLLMVSAILAADKDGSEWLVLFPLLSAGFATTVEVLPGRAFKETVLWLLLGCPLLAWIL